jgi:hypothetical protein
MGVVIIPARHLLALRRHIYIQYMGGIEPGIPTITAALTYLARVVS